MVYIATTRCRLYLMVEPRRCRRQKGAESRSRRCCLFVPEQHSLHSCTHLPRYCCNHYCFLLFLPNPHYLEVGDCCRRQEVPHRYCQRYPHLHSGLLHHRRLRAYLGIHDSPCWTVDSWRHFDVPLLLVHQPVTWAVARTVEGDLLEETPWVSPDLHRDVSHYHRRYCSDGKNHGESHVDHDP